LPRGVTRRPATPRGSSLLRVIYPSTGYWDAQLVTDTFWPEAAEITLSIPTDERYPDWPAWHYDPAGRFSVKSAYKLAVQIRDQMMGDDASTSNSNNDTSFKWYRIWQLQAPNKLKIRLDEDSGHIFSKCKKVREC
ncbi:hypothetical protein U9M48_025957, partial [Paspalum notatum var. saurae]